jgi:hypothetical protein
MKNNKPAKASTAAPSKSNVCGTDTTATGKAAANANKACKDKIDSAVEDLKTPGAEAA